MDNTLEVAGLNMRFGGIIALQDVKFEVASNSITALIGPNGAGKTTVFNCLTGFYRTQPGGSIRMKKDNREINLVQLIGERFTWQDFISPVAFARRLFYKMFGGTHQVNRAGLARTFQNTRLFKEMTVIENLLVAQHMHMERGLLSGVINSRHYIAAEKEAMDRARKWLDYFNLSHIVNRIAGELPYGEQKRLEIARAMCTRPQLLCLDEPAAGLNPQETADLSKMIKALRDEFNVTILVIEHDMRLVMNISDHIVVLDHGEVLFAGTPAEVKKNPKVIAAYLGSAE